MRQLRIDSGWESHGRHATVLGYRNIAPSWNANPAERSITPSREPKTCRRYLRLFSSMMVGSADLEYQPVSEFPSLVTSAAL